MSDRNVTCSININDDTGTATDDALVETEEHKCPDLLLISPL